MSEPNKEVKKPEVKPEVKADIVDNIKVEVKDKDVDPRLTKAVEMLIKQTGIDPEKIKDKTMAEKFDLLTFYAENQPEKEEMDKNEPVIPVPANSTAKIGRRIKDGQGGDYWLFKPSEWVNVNKSK